jgi:hypothetical protein
VREEGPKPGCQTIATDWIQDSRTETLVGLTLLHTVAACVSERDTRKMTENAGRFISPASSSRPESPYSLESLPKLFRISERQP